MGLKIHSLAEIPYEIERSYYLYVLDYYNWDEPIGNTLHSNFNRMAEFASKNDAVIIQPVGDSHFFSELLSWQEINGMKPEELLPALMITSLHPKYFLERDNKEIRGEPIPKNEIIFLQLKNMCTTSNDVLDVIEQIFSDIRKKEKISNFKIKKELKAGVGNTLVDSLILEPNIAGVGVDIKKLFSFFRTK